MSRRTRGKLFHFYVNQCPECRNVTNISLRPHNQVLCAKCEKTHDAKRRGGPKAQGKEIDMSIPDEEECECPSGYHDMFEECRGY